MKTYVVEFACGPDGDHKTPITECCGSSTKEFTKINPLLDFIGECSYVYNLNSLLNQVAKNKDKSLIKENQVIIKNEIYE